MSVFKTFEEINAWQNARVLVKDVYALTRCGDFGKGYYDSPKQIGGMLFNLISSLSSDERRTKK